MTFDAYGELMINRGSCILILLHLYCCSKHKFSLRYLSRKQRTLPVLSRPDILIQKNCLIFCVFYLYDVLYMVGVPLWNTVSYDYLLKIQRNSLKKSAILHPCLPITATFPQRPLSSVPKGAVVEMFDCNNSCTITPISVNFSAIPAQLRRENPFSTSSERR